MKEIIAITSHPSTSSLMEMTNDMIDEIRKKRAKKPPAIVAN